MSLIDPSTPEGFFHMRLAAYKVALTRQGHDRFQGGANASQSSYFDTLEPDAAPWVPVVAPQAGKAVIEQLRNRWSREGEELLFSMTDVLESLREKLNDTSDDEPAEEPVSDFVYPIF